MSANDILIIGKEKGKFVVRHADMDGCYNHIEGTFDTFMEARECAKRYEENEP